ncbi:MAG TPA: alanine--tRNA ligase, partial [Candidatus Methanoperedenaceae archaeon]|nr:alanine--tRNA ligase [Candidatus Methanoperedenaceae archaeon]
MEPVETVYAITDHTRCLAFMLGDGIIPSNVKAGYLARLVIRRTLRMLRDLHISAKLSDLVLLHIDNMPEYPEFRERIDTITEILALEEERFADTLDRGRRLVQKTAAHFRERNETIPEVELIQLYDTHGIPPEIAKEAAAEAGVRVELSDTFYSLVAKKHNRAEAAEREEPGYRLPGIKPTLGMYYDAPAQAEFRAKVVAVVNGGVVLDRTLFYPEGGGQPADHGTLYAGNESSKVLDVQILDGIIVHEVDSQIFRKGDEVTGKIDWERRSAHMRHHTATHIINESAKKVLGKHIWQTGAQKSVDRARLDITHFKRITGEELNRIEMLANREVMADIPVEITWKERVEAEKRYGFVLYQGGVPPGREIRILKVGDDVEACGGTHVPSTGRIGAIKVLRTERIQDGVERIEFAAGDAAVKWMQERDRLLDSSADVLRVSSEHLPETVERFFNEWKDLKKENERLKEELAGMRVKVMLGDAEEIGGVRVVRRLVPDADMEELLKIASEFSKNDEVVALLASADGAGGAKIVVSAGAKATLRGINAGAIAKAMSGTVGGGGGGKLSIAQGGGPRGDKIDEALIRGIELIREKLG